MKFNQRHLGSLPICRFVAISFVTIICFPLFGYATNLDSLKHILDTSKSPKDECSAVYEIYEHWKSIGELDSMSVYSRMCLEKCAIREVDDWYIVNKLVLDQYKSGFASNIELPIDSLLLVMEDPDLKLRLLVILSRSNYYSQKDKGAFEKYWRQAEIVLPNAKSNNARYLYYNLLGNINSSEKNIFAALQSFELAKSFVGKNSNYFLRNSSNLAYVYLEMGEVEKAKDAFYDLLESAKEKGLARRQSFIYFGLIDCYDKSNDYYKVIELAHKAIKHVNKNNLNVPNGYSYSLIAKSYLALSGMDQEIGYLDRSADYNLKNNSSIAYLDSSKYYSEKGIEYSLDHNHAKELADNYLTMADYYKAIGNREKAIIYLTKAQSEKSYYVNTELDKKLADLWAAEDSYSKAYFHLARYTDHKLQRDKNGKKDMVLATKIIEDSYKYKDESQAMLLTANQKEERLQNVITFALGGLSLIVLLLIYVQRNRLKLKTLNNEVAQRNRELDILITKQKETIKYLDNFAGVAAHDLKAPIRTASSFAGLLAKVSGDKLDDKEKEYLKYVDKSVAQLSGMIDDLLSLSRLDSDLPESKQVNLNEVIIEVKALLSSVLNKTDSKIVVESTLPMVMGHSTLMCQLFSNIIKNAIVHNKTGNNTIVNIVTEFDQKNRCLIKISDNSGGIPDYIVPSMFELFSSSNKETGNGIGLATCKKIVNHYGGEIWVDVNKGVGTTFNFTLINFR